MESAKEILWLIGGLICVIAAIFVGLYEIAKYIVDGYENAKDTRSETE